LTPLEVSPGWESKNMTLKKNKAPSTLKKTRKYQELINLYQVKTRNNLNLNKNNTKITIKTTTTILTIRNNLSSPHLTVHHPKEPYSNKSITLLNYNLPSKQRSC